MESRFNIGDRVFFLIRDEAVEDDEGIGTIIDVVFWKGKYLYRMEGMPDLTIKEEDISCHTDPNKR